VRSIRGAHNRVYRLEAFIVLYDRVVFADRAQELRGLFTACLLVREVPAESAPRVHGTSQAVVKLRFEDHVLEAGIGQQFVRGLVFAGYSSQGVPCGSAPDEGVDVVHTVSSGVTSRRTRTP
jgi:hypothetical protein